MSQTLEQLKSIQSSPVEANLDQLVLPGAVAQDPAESIKQLEELANAARATFAGMDLQERAASHLQEYGFNKSGAYFRESKDRLGRIQQFTKNDVTIQTSLDMPSQYIDSFNDSVPNAEPLQELIAQFRTAKHELDHTKLQFRCGQLRYTLKRPLTAALLKEACHDFCLPEQTDIERVEKELHFRFQTLYRKIPQRWTEAENNEWTFLLKYIDLEEYRNDNPPAEHRIGRIESVDQERVVIRWQTAGKVVYDPRTVPGEVLASQEGWIVHALFQRLYGDDLWLSTRIEPPLALDTDILHNDLECAKQAAQESFPVADWPKIQE